jgi:hypothetical protein
MVRPPAYPIQYQPPLFQPYAAPRETSLFVHGQPLQYCQLAQSYQQPTAYPPPYQQVIAIDILDSPAILLSDLND